MKKLNNFKTLLVSVSASLTLSATVFAAHLPADSVSMGFAASQTLAASGSIGSGAKAAGSIGSGAKAAGSIGSGAK
jgi:hypothetical protein